MTYTELCARVSALIQEQAPTESFYVEVHDWSHWHHFSNCREREHGWKIYVAGYEQYVGPTAEAALQSFMDRFPPLGNIAADAGVVDAHALDLPVAAVAEARAAQLLGEKT